MNMTMEGAKSIHRNNWSGAEGVCHVAGPGDPSSVPKTYMDGEAGLLKLSSAAVWCGECVHKRLLNDNDFRLWERLSVYTACGFSKGPKFGSRHPHWCSEHL